MTGPIYVVERITTQPGAAQRLVAAIRDEYLPLATARGMSLDRILVSPPIWDAELSNEVTVTWTVPNTAAWWQMAKGGRADRRSAEFWTTHAELIAHRDRSMAAASDIVEELADV